MKASRLRLSRPRVALGAMPTLAVGMIGMNILDLLLDVRYGN